MQCNTQQYKQSDNTPFTGKGNLDRLRAIQKKLKKL